MDNELELNNPEETCSLCGEKLTRYGNKKLKDGILCRNCAKLISAWLSDEDLEHRTVEDMKRHMAYREQNQEKLAAFKGVKSVDGKYSLYIDADQKCFVFSKRKDLQKENADVIPLSAIKEMSITEEDYLNEGTVDLNFEMKLDHDELNTLNFRVNEFPGVGKESDEYATAEKAAFAYLDTLVDQADATFKDVTE